MSPGSGEHSVWHSWRAVSWKRTPWSLERPGSKSRSHSGTAPPEGDALNHKANSQDRLRRCQNAMTMQFISHRFPDYHDPTIEDAYKTQVRIDDEPAYLDILDTAGQAEFTAMRDQYMRGGEGFIICYSITDRQSFQEAAEFKELIYRVRHTYDIPLVLVGNKIDLEEFRQVSTEEGMSLAREYSCSFFETSAALRFYIDDVFHGLVREIRRKESSLPLTEKKMKRKDSLWQMLKGSLKKKRESTT
ncbi:GTP-binding protein Rit2 isoform X1 [Mauremys mutica]|nr:GTP-binding protein Rit2 isoform X1 [Mauremys mutica]